VLVWRRDVDVLHRTLDHGDDAGARATELLLDWLGGQALAAPAGQ